MTVEEFREELKAALTPFVGMPITPEVHEQVKAAARPIVLRFITIPAPEITIQFSDGELIRINNQTEN